MLILIISIYLLIGVLIALVSQMAMANLPRWRRASMSIVLALFWPIALFVGFVLLH